MSASLSGARTADPRPGDVVWLVPRTPGAPAICWSQPCAVVVQASAVRPGYIAVHVDGVRHEVHRHNIRRSDPAHDRRRTTRPATAPTPARATDMEVPLW